MKKPIIVFVALTILTIIIGSNDIGRDWQSSVSGRPMERQKGSETGSKKVVENLLPPDQPSSGSPDIRPATLSSGISNIIPEQMIGSNQHSRVATVAKSCASNPPLLHYIRSSKIAGTSELSTTEIERLRKAMSILGNNLTPSSLIFDADTGSTSEAPFILFSKEEFDLTNKAKLIYDRLLAEDGSFPKSAIVESTPLR